MARSPKTARRSLSAALAALGLGVGIALAPAASASAASSSITIVNNCGANVSVNIYLDTNWVMGGVQPAGTTRTYTAHDNLNRTYRVEVPRSTYFPWLADGRGYVYRAC